jgi:hypothetical protein
MQQKSSAQSKIPTKNPQPARRGAKRPSSPAHGSTRSRRTSPPSALPRGDARTATRGSHYGAFRTRAIRARPVIRRGSAGGPGIR